MSTDGSEKSLLAQRYDVVNATWPPNLPPLSHGEAVLAARRLYRFGFSLFDIKRNFKGKVHVGSGNRYNWVARGVLTVNPSRGWHHLVHDLSHYVHGRATSERAHRDGHAWVEKQMIEYVLRSGWLDGKLKRPELVKQPANRKLKNFQRVCERLKKWESRLRRAQTALRTLRAAQRRYERQGLTSYRATGSP